MIQKPHKKMYDDCLVDGLINFEYGIPTQKEVIRRSKLVLKAANELGISTSRLCLKYTRCGYFHCNVCRRSQQLGLLHEVQKFETFRSKNQLKMKCWRAITIIPEYGLCDLQSLPEGGIEQFGQQIKKTLKMHAPRIQGVFVIEPSVNTDLTGVSKCQWHVHGIFNKVKREEYKAIQRGFAWPGQHQSLDLLRRFTPVMQMKVTDLYGQVAYMAKARILSRREVDVKKRNTAKNIPSSRQEALIATALFPEKIESRLIFINMKSVKDRLDEII